MFEKYLITFWVISGFASFDRFVKKELKDKEKIEMADLYFAVAFGCLGPCYFFIDAVLFPIFDLIERKFYFSKEVKNPFYIEK